MARFGAPTEVANKVLSLVQNAYVTGQTISVNGGVYITLEQIPIDLTHSPRA